MFFLGLVHCSLSYPQNLIRPKMSSSSHKNMGTERGRHGKTCWTCLQYVSSRFQITGCGRHKHIPPIVPLPSPPPSFHICHFADRQMKSKYIIYINTVHELFDFILCSLPNKKNKNEMFTYLSAPVLLLY